MDTGEDTTRPPLVAADRRPRAFVTAAPRRSTVLSWLVPAEILGAAALWLVPLADRGPAAQALVDDAVGNWVVLAIWLVWATSLAVVVSSLRRNGRTAGPAWTAVQVALVLSAVVWALPPLLIAVPGSAEQITAGIAHRLLPVLVLALSAVQAVLVFLRA